MKLLIPPEPQILKKQFIKQMKELERQGTIRDGSNLSKWSHKKCDKDHSDRNIVFDGYFEKDEQNQVVGFSFKNITSKILESNLDFEDDNIPPNETREILDPFNEPSGNLSDPMFS